MSKVSIIVPIYNGEKVIRRCVDSIINQDYRDLEIILVDDGSKDDSFAIALKAIEGRGNCHIYRQGFLHFLMLL